MKTWLVLLSADVIMSWCFINSVLMLLRPPATVGLVLFHFKR